MNPDPNSGKGASSAEAPPAITTAEAYYEASLEYRALIEKIITTPTATDPAGTRALLEQAQTLADALAAYEYDHPR